MLQSLARYQGSFQTFVMMWGFIHACGTDTPPGWRCFTQNMRSHLDEGLSNFSKTRINSILLVSQHGLVVDEPKPLPHHRTKKQTATKKTRDS